MASGRFGGPRPLVDEDGKGPLGFDRPFVKDKTEQLIAEIESAVSDEQSADIDYHRIIMLLREGGREDLASQVESIRNDEQEHKEQFKSMLSELRRETSF